MSLEARLTRLEQHGSAAGRCATCADRAGSVRLVRALVRIPWNGREPLPTAAVPCDPADASPCRCGWRPEVQEIGAVEIYVAEGGNGTGPD